MQTARRDDVLDPFVDAMRLASRRSAERRAGGGVPAGCERAQAERAIEILIRRRDAILLGTAGRRIVDQVDAGRRRDAVAGAEDLRFAVGRERSRNARRAGAET